MGKPMGKPEKSYLYKNHTNKNKTHVLDGFVNMSLRKVTKSPGSFSNNEAVIKLFYLALQNINKKWTIPLRNWNPALNRFTIQLEERMPQQ
jgi:transposase-like protein